MTSFEAVRVCMACQSNYSRIYVKTGQDKTRDRRRQPEWWPIYWPGRRAATEDGTASWQWTASDEISIAKRPFFRTLATRPSSGEDNHVQECGFGVHETWNFRHTIATAINHNRNGLLGPARSPEAGSSQRWWSQWRVPHHHRSSPLQMVERGGITQRRWWGW